MNSGYDILAIYPWGYCYSKKSVSSLDSEVQRVSFPFQVVDRIMDPLGQKYIMDCDILSEYYNSSEMWNITSR